MNKPAIAILAALGVIFAGVFGGYIYAERTVQHRIETAFANASELGAIQSASFDTLDVSLIGDTVTLTGLKAEIDPQVLVDASFDTADGTLEGTVTQTAKTAVVTGVRELVFGGRVLDTVTITQPRTETDLMLTVTNAMGKTHAQHFEGKLVGARLYFEAFDTTPFLSTPFNVEAMNIRQARADALVLDFSVTDMPSDGTPTQDAAQNRVRAIYKVDRLHAQEITTKRIGGGQMDGISMEIRNPGTPFPMVEIKAESAHMGETIYDNGMPIKASSEIRNITANREGAPPDPKLERLRTFLGVEEIEIDVLTAYDLSPKTGEGTFGPIALTVHDGGRASATFDLSALPDFTAMEELQMQAQNDAQARAQIQAELQKRLTQASVKGVAVEYEDRGGLRKFIEAQAEQHAGGDTAMVVEAMARQGAGLVSLSHGPETAQRVYETLKTYLADPGTLRIELTSDTSVKIVELLMGFQVAGPRALGVMDLQISLPES